MNKKIVVGDKEFISISSLELFDLDAKIDTGADSCALHCDDIFIDENNFVHFTLLDEVHPSYHGKKMSLPLYKLKKVKSSNGEIQSRPCVEVEVQFFEKKYKIAVSLTSRADMKYPMLIGKNLLKNGFLVDVSKSYLSKGLA